MAGGIEVRGVEEEGDETGLDPSSMVNIFALMFQEEPTLIQSVVLLELPL